MELAAAILFLSVLKLITGNSAFASRVHLTGPNTNNHDSSSNDRISFNPFRATKSAVGETLIKCTFSYDPSIYEFLSSYLLATFASISQPLSP